MTIVGAKIGMKKLKAKKKKEKFWKKTILSDTKQIKNRSQQCRRMVCFMMKKRYDQGGKGAGSEV